jgi:hypothetical protein
MLTLVTLAGAGSLAAQITDGSTSDEYKRTLSALERYRVLAPQTTASPYPQA